jgi:hypothetical protein
MAVPHRNDVTVRTALGPDENHHSAIQPSCGDHAHVAQIGLFAGPSGMIALEYPRRIGEIKPAMGEGSVALGGVESDFHGINVNTIICRVNIFVCTNFISPLAAAQQAEWIPGPRLKARPGMTSVNGSGLAGQARASLRLARTVPKR